MEYRAGSQLVTEIGRCVIDWKNLFAMNTSISRMLRDAF